MIQLFSGHPGLGVSTAIDNMHRDRKQVFVDLLRWDVPVIDDMFEIDQFDTSEALYLVEAGDDGEHSGSFRFLPTDRPHLLGSLFPDLCTQQVPSGATIFEITRGCLSPRLRAAERLRVRNRLISAAVRHGLDIGLSAFTCVADSGWLRQIREMGWACRPLGSPRPVAGVITGALQIDLSNRTVELLRASGTFCDVLITHAAVRPALAA